MKTWPLVLLFACAPHLAAQRDFLTADETDQVRLAQDPNERLALYVKFAKDRLALAQQVLSNDKPGRSLLIHDALEDYGNIVDAIDTVADDALKRRIDISQGMAAVAEGEKELLAGLQKIQESDPKDIARYEFVLKQAIDSTQDSLDLSSQDLSARAESVQKKEAQEKKEQEAVMQPKDLEARKEDEKKLGDTGKGKRKPPTLLRKGEKAPDR